MEKVGHTVDRKEGLVYRERKRDGSREDIRERKSKRVREKEGREEGGGSLPHESHKQHDHDEVRWILISGLVLIQTTRDKHLQTANDCGGHHLNCT